MSELPDTPIWSNDADETTALLTLLLTIPMRQPFQSNFDLVKDINYWYFTVTFFSHVLCVSKSVWNHFMPLSQGLVGAS